MRYPWTEARVAPANRDGEVIVDPEASVEEAAKTQRPALGALLIEAGLVTAEQIRAALAEGLATGERLGEVIVRRGWATEERVAQLLAVQWQLRFRKAETISIDPMAIRRLSQADARRLRAVPVWFDDGGLVLAIEEPATELFATVKEVLGDVSYVVVARSTLDHLLKSRFLTDDTPSFVTDDLRVSVADEQAFLEEHASGRDSGPATEPETDAAAVAEVETDLASADETDPELDEAPDVPPDAGVPIAFESGSELSVVADIAPESELTLGPALELVLVPDDPSEDGPVEAAAQPAIQEEPEGQAEVGDEGAELPAEGGEQVEMPVAEFETAPAVAEPDADEEQGTTGEVQEPASQLNDETAPTESGADDWGNNVVSISSEIDMDAARGSNGDVGFVLSSIEEASSGLRAIQREVSSLGESLRQAHDQLAQREAQLEAAEAAQRQGEETIRHLESELERRNDHLAALRVKVAELNQTLEAAPV